MIRFAFPFVKLARTVCGLMVALCLAGALSDRRCGAFAAPFPAQKSNGKSADSSKSKSRSDSKAAAADADEDGDDPESITDPEAPRTEDSETSARVEKRLAESSTEDDFSDDQRFPPETGSFGDLSESKRQRYSETLRALLAEGLKPVTADARKSQVEAGRKRFESARQLCDDD
ncbi:MAG: hypothetical protein NT069_19300, partial [Planctomycetota bacterium]|nr:hypothetical protein [Planctomycetota bacterium]